MLLGTDGDCGPPPKLVPLRVKTFPYAGAHLPEIKRALIFEAEVQRDEFARAVLVAAQTILERHGVDGYAKTWNFTFARYPLRALRALETLLSITEPASAVAGDA